MKLAYFTTFVIISQASPLENRREILARLGRRPYKSIAPAALSPAEIARQELIGGMPLEKMSREEIMAELEDLER